MIAAASRDQALLRFQGLRFAFGANQVLREADGELFAGDVVLLEGSNGSGKTTLLNLLSGHLVPAAGEIELAGRKGMRTFRFPTARSPGPERLAREGVSRSWQEVRLFDSLDLAENLVIAGTNSYLERPWRALAHPRSAHVAHLARRADAATTLERFAPGLNPGASAAAISTGERKRVSIAQAWEAGARVLLLDEPLSGLDGPGVVQVLGLLRQLSEEALVATVIVEHELNVGLLSSVLTRRWRLVDGAIQELNPSPADPEPEGSWAGWLVARLGFPGDQSQVVELGGARLHRIPASREALPGRPVITGRNLVVRRGHQATQRAEGSGLTLALGPSELGVLVAPNGWGKTTLLDGLAGVLPLAGGEIWLDGERRPEGAAAGSATWSARRGLGYVRSRPAAWSTLAVRELLRLAGVDPPPDVRPLLPRLWSELSGGQRQRISWTLAVRRPGLRLLLADEPFTGLDQAAVERTIAELRAFVETGGAALLALPGRPELPAILSQEMESQPCA